MNFLTLISGVLWTQESIATASEYILGNITIKAFSSWTSSMSQQDAPRGRHFGSAAPIGRLVAKYVY